MKLILSGLLIGLSVVLVVVPDTEWIMALSLLFFPAGVVVLFSSEPFAEKRKQ